MACICMFELSIPLPGITLISLGILVSKQCQSLRWAETCLRTCRVTEGPVNNQDANLSQPIRTCADCGTILYSMYSHRPGPRFKTNSRFIQWMHGPPPTVQDVSATSPTASFIE